MISKYIKRLALGGMAIVSMASLTSCNDWLGEPSPGSTELGDFFNSGEACLQTINGCYTPLAWEYNRTYFSEWMIGDIASDDALKGGQNVADGSDAYDIDNFKVNANNAILLDYYRAKYQGIIRCNLALREVGEYELDETLTEDMKNRLLGEAYFLRGLYYFQLVRIFGGVPLVDDVLESADQWQQPRATAADTYAHVIADFEKAESLLWNKSKYADEDAGRATKGAAQAYLLKAHLYNHNYDEAYTWGKKFMEEQASEYSLFTNYADNFNLAGENGAESIFEIQYMADPTSDYGEGFGFTRGTFTTILTRPRMSTLGGNAGWGWDHPTQNLYDAFEEGDPRRAETIGIPDEEALDEIEVNYLGSPYYNIKTSYYEAGTFPNLDHASRAPLNYRLMRLSDVMLMYAEAALESGKDLGVSKTMLENVRSRARNMAGSSVLPSFPNYLGYSDDTESLRQAIRHERRVELGMEGHRWFDLVRWGIAYQVMDKDSGSYGSNESEEARAEMASFVPGKHELFPIPSEEIILNPMEQNPGY